MCHNRHAPPHSFLRSIVPFSVLSLHVRQRGIEVEWRRYWCINNKMKWVQIQIFYRKKINYIEHTYEAEKEEAAEVDWRPTGITEKTPKFLVCRAACVIYYVEPHSTETAKQIFIEWHLDSDLCGMLLRYVTTAYPIYFVNIVYKQPKQILKNIFEKEEDNNRVNYDYGPFSPPARAREL